jgi:YD repeat-containing protein
MSFRWIKNAVIRRGNDNPRKVISLHLGILVTLVGASALDPMCIGQSGAPPDAANVGLPINGEFSGGSVDSVQLNNGNLHIDIPLLEVPGVGIPVRIHFTYDSKIWDYNFNEDTATYGVSTSRSAVRLAYPGAVTWNYTSHQNTVDCGYGNTISAPVLDGMDFVDEDGSAHQFPVQNSYMTDPPPCDNRPAPLKLYALDSSGIQANRDPSSGEITSVITKHGTKYTFSTPQIAGVDLEDTNGNKLMTSLTGGGPQSQTTVITDTLGRQFSITGYYTHGYQPELIQYTGQNGVAQSITIDYMSVAIDSSSLCPGGLTCIGAGVGTAFLPQSITLQDGVTKYSFDYYSSGLGDLKSMTLPTGATISWTYGQSDVAGDKVVKRTVTSGNQTSVWKYSYTIGPSSSETDGDQNLVTVTDPLSNDTQYTCTVYVANPFTSLPATSHLPPCYMTKEQVFNGAASGGNVLVTKTTGYTITGAILPTSTKVTWQASNQTAETDASWDVIPMSGFYSGPDNPANDVSWGNPLSKLEYDYGTGSPGALIKNTQYSYLHLQSGGSSYQTANIADRVTQESIYNSATVGSSSLIAQTNTFYDGFSQSAQNGLLSTSGTSNHDYTNFGSSTTLRGLPTSVSRYVAANQPNVVTYTNYNDLGNPTVTTDGKGYSSQIQYGAENAFLQLTTFPTTSNGVTHSTSEQHDLNTGLLSSRTDENGKTTHYSYDGLFRPTLTTYPDGGSVSKAYPNPNTVETDVDQSPNPTSIRTQILDGLGREQETAESVGGVAGLAAGFVYTNTTYDLLGRKYQVWNPTTCNPPNANCGESTWGYTTFQYDSLSRIISQQNPDSSIKYWCYDGVPTSGQSTCPSHISGSAGEWVNLTNENGAFWQQTIDALGRLTSVIEPNGTSNTTTMETDYGYDALGNLISVNQWGGPTSASSSLYRGFRYDGLSELQSASNPETGTIGYSYDSNGNVHTKNDARSIITTYDYDQLNRLVDKTYSDNTTLTSCYLYDTSTNGKGRLAVEWTQNASISSCASIFTPSTNYSSAKSIVSYDAMGRVTSEYQYTPASTAAMTYYPVQFSYDNAGNLKSSTAGFVPSSMTFATPTVPCAASFLTSTMLEFVNCYDAAGRVQSVTSNSGSGPTSLFAAQGYAPHGGLSDAEYGGNDVILGRTFDNRLRINSETDLGYSSGTTASGFATTTIIGQEQSH